MKRYMAMFWMLAAAAFAGDQIPVYGPARAGVEDWDLLQDTVLDVGEIAYDPSMPTELRVGDGITPGGIVVRQDGTVTNFSQISTATTNLNMRHFSIAWGAWHAQGDARALNFTWGRDEVWLRFVRDSGAAYLPYDFSILDENVFRFEVANAVGDTPPVLQVSTNLLEGYAAAPDGTFGTSRPDAAHLSIVYTNASPISCIFFRVFDASGLSSGAYFSVPVHAARGYVDASGSGVTNWGDLTGPLAAGIATNAAAIAANAGGIATNAAAIAQNAGAIATNAAAIAQNSARIAQNAGNIHSNAAGLAVVTNALGQRISDFEEVTIGYQALSTNTYNIPTNFPTRELVIYVSANAFTETTPTVRLNLPNWTPNRPVRIRVYVGTWNANTTADYLYGGTKKTSGKVSSGLSGVEWTWLHQPACWEMHMIRAASYRFVRSADPSGNYLDANNLPTTVEDWIAWRNQQTW